MGSSAFNQILNTDVFIEPGPMDAEAIGDELEFISFLWLAMKKARIPFEWNRKSPSINQVNGQPVVTDLDPLRSDRCFGAVQSAHSNAPTLTRRFLQSTSRCLSIGFLESHCYVP